MNPLALEKQLLIAESELNRAQLAGNMAALRVQVRTLTSTGKAFGAIASSIAVLIAGVREFRRVKRVLTDEKTSWLQTLVKIIQAKP